MQTRTTVVPDSQLCTHLVAPKSSVFQLPESSLSIGSALQFLSEIQKKNALPLAADPPYTPPIVQLVAPNHHFQGGNHHFLLQNLDFLLQNLRFLLKNLRFLLSNGFIYAQGLPQRRGWRTDLDYKFISFNARVIIINAKYVIFNARIIIINAKFIMFHTECVCRGGRRVLVSIEFLTEFSIENRSESRGKAHIFIAFPIFQKWLVFFKIRKIVGSPSPSRGCLSNKNVNKNVNFLW